MLSHFFRIITTWLFTLLSNIGVILTRLTLFLSRVHPFMYLLLYLIAIPSFASLFMVFAPHGFYAPYARYEPSAREDTGSLASCLKAVLYRSFNDRAGQDLVIGKWKLNPSSLSVDDIQSSDGKQLTFRVRISADGIDEPLGQDFDLIITTYGYANRVKWLEEKEWDLIILDEAQAIKNIRACRATIRFLIVETCWSLELVLCAMLIVEEKRCGK